MAQETKVIPKDRSESPGKRSLRAFGEGRARRSAHSKLYSDMDALVTVAYKNGIAALDWKEDGIVLIAERDEDGNVAIKKSKHRQPIMRLRSPKTSVYRLARYVC